MLRIGVLGVGQMGKIHLRCLQQLSDYFELTTFFDHQMAAAKEAMEMTGLMPSHSVDHMLEQVDAVVIAVPTVAHYKLAIQAIRQFKHVFIERPVCSDMQEARALLKLAREAEVICQVGFQDRWNPSFKAALPLIKHPSFIECRRFKPSHQHGLDVSVVLDLMMDDIDLVLKLTKANVRRITANGCAVFSSLVDVANVRLEMDNGAVAQFIASRIHHQEERKMTIFERDQYLTLDVLNESLTQIDAVGLAHEKVKDIPVHSVNPILQGWMAFHQAVSDKRESAVTLEEGLKSLEICLQAAEMCETSTMVNEERVFLPSLGQ